MTIRLRLRTGASLLLALLALPAAAGDERQTLTVGGMERHYVLRMTTLPDAQLRSAPRPLVLVLHGGGGNAANAETMTGFTDKARAEGFIVVYPEGTGRFGRFLTWNAGHCCGHAMQRKVDDVAFIVQLIDALAREYPVDRHRVYVTGMSNGGMMAHRLGRELPTRVAAIAPVVGAVFGDETPPPVPVSALVINGLLDRSVPYAGGPPGGRFTNAWDGTPILPAQAQAQFWAKTDHCGAEPRKSETWAMLRWQYDCPGQLAVEWLVVKDNGHAWPGGRKGSRHGDTPSAAVKATDLIWDFFASHSLPARLEPGMSQPATIE